MIYSENQLKKKIESDMKTKMSSSDLAPKLEAELLSDKYHATNNANNALLKKVISL